MRNAFLLLEISSSGRSTFSIEEAALQIRTLKEAGLIVTVALGKNGDTYLREIPDLHDLDLVFLSGESLTLWAGIKAGAEALKGPFWLQPQDANFMKSFKDFRSQVDAEAASKPDILASKDQDGNPQFPWYITSQGAQKLARLEKENLENVIHIKWLSPEASNSLQIIKNIEESSHHT